jgi:hypothetical protein
MKKLLVIPFLLLGFLIAAQSDCIVKSEKLQGTYVGACKKGLAHGKGLAAGKDTYKGKFKNGFPHGRGVYTYADGSVYKGEFKEGRRDGRGNYTRMINGEKVLKEGFWEDDVYVGPKKIKPYNIKLKRNIDRFNFSNIGEGNDVKIFIKQNGRTNASVSGIMITASSGEEMSVAHNFGYKDVDFPFTCQVRYNTKNKLQTLDYEVVFEFEILKEGNWIVTLHN